MKIFIVGSGKLANAILTSDLSIPSCEILHWESEYTSINEKAILIHAGSGRQLEECLKYCSRTKSVFIELATGSATENKVYDFPLIICPNTSVLVLKTLNMIKAYGSYFENYDISILESHQSTKKTETGTALAFADALKFAPNRITSIRDPEFQQNTIRIPEKFLDQHAFHKIVIKDEDDELTIETKVLGHGSYVKGVRKIIETVLYNDLENKKYTVLDLIRNDLI